MSGAAAAREHVHAFDVMRTVAAAAVVAIHVIGPYRAQIGAIPDVEWASAIALNGALRWCVPVFIMITGALLLADPRPFDAAYFVRRRVAKVLVPFVAWSLVYALLSGVAPDGFDAATVREVLLASPTHETYYHLGFFYYFIPLYLLVPPLRALVQRGARIAAWLLLGLWLGCTTAYLTGLRGVWSMDLVMFGGYLLLGWTLWRVGAPPLAPLALLALLAIAAVAAVAAGDVAVIRDSLAAGRYDVGSWFSYKTINTVVVAVFVFVLALRLAPALSERARAAFAFVGRHSLGIYLIHPLFLWPVRAWDLYGGHPLVVVPLYTAAAGALALAASVCLSRSRATAWLVP